MYLGRSSNSTYVRPSASSRHPYTETLIATIPDWGDPEAATLVSGSRSRRRTVRGVRLLRDAGTPAHLPGNPELLNLSTSAGGEHLVACHLADELNLSAT